MEVLIWLETVNFFFGLALAGIIASAVDRNTQNKLLVLGFLILGPYGMIALFVVWCAFIAAPVHIYKMFKPYARK